MKPNSDAIASPAPAAEFDREITDMDSELAVCFCPDTKIESTS
jgi:hypothetical protein